MPGLPSTRGGTAVDTRDYPTPAGYEVTARRLIAHGFTSPASGKISPYVSEVVRSVAARWGTFREVQPIKDNGTAGNLGRARRL
jgi:hypothetical protein